MMVIFYQRFSYHLITHHVYIKNIFTVLFSVLCYCVTVVLELNIDWTIMSECEYYVYPRIVEWLYVANISEHSPPQSSLNNKGQTTTPGT